MDLNSDHNIAEQMSSYRRGVVLGLTMAEVGILIIFVLLMLLGIDMGIRQRLEQQLSSRSTIAPARLDALLAADSALQEIRKQVQVADNPTIAEIQMLVRALADAAATPQGQSALRDVRQALDEMRNIREQINLLDSSTSVGDQVEQQSLRIATQEGQLQHYEKRFQEQGLGKGERPCWVRPDGTIEFLYDVVLSSSGIRMREYEYEHRVRDRSTLPMPTVDPKHALSPEEFLRSTRPLFNTSLAENCRFFVVIYDDTGPTEKELYKMLLRTVEAHFYKRIDYGPAPF